MGADERYQKRISWRCTNTKIQDSHCCTEDRIRMRGYKRNMIQQALGQAAAWELVLVAYLTKIIVYMSLVLRTTCVC